MGSWQRLRHKIKNSLRQVKAASAIKVGACFFDWEGDGETDHVGIVERVENGTVYTVEGNSGDSCKLNDYAIGSSVIYGYGIPQY